MGNLAALTRPDGPGVVRGLAIATLTVGIGVWAALLLAPVPTQPPPMLDAGTAAGQDTGRVAGWFGGNALRVPVVVTGVIWSNGGRAAALLSVNGSPAQAYRVGQSLAPGVTLAAVTANGVSIDQDGVIEQVAMQDNPTNLIQGFIPVTEATTADKR
ncbi:hypothetical protein LKR43_04430 [Pusillimonas sp. MFBS29]|uniref:type II secretion system protein N n=1 Tax=Pusillimonas sp. MFBS29 TaxID=2886690 RepID=UPI001D123974|nr:type II secretion system protein N [Pusillimonas sp. MFBS29]MCC2595582.1 hypothetical protein [Pusillimonas sp. MFBS29]